MHWPELIQSLSKWPCESTAPSDSVAEGSGCSPILSYNQAES